jgi:hypothetical protein
MFGFPRGSASGPGSTGLRQALARTGLAPGVDAATIGVVETRGRYAGRRVTYFRVFDQTRAATRAVSVRAVADLDAHPDLVLGAGHVEQNGAPVFAARASAADGPVPARQPADRAAHVDDAHLVFGTRKAPARRRRNCPGLLLPGSTPAANHLSRAPTRRRLSLDQ